MTGTESLMLTQLILSDRRVVSKNDLIQRIDKDPENYSGLEMCLSRLQKKFKTAAKGERLIRSVRNRGYCLAQRIRVAY
nr:helix-turn-helix domain-containing protein [Pseudomonas sp. PGPR40]